MNFECKHLVIEGDRVVLLGYELCLTPNEKKILSVVADGGATTAELLEAITHLRHVDIGNIATHVAAINKKAKQSGGRRLIVSKNRKYILNEFM